MARVKNKQPSKPVSPLGVADGFDFDSEEENDFSADEELIEPISVHPASKEKNTAITTAGRTYSPYYIPHPKTGKKGGVIGHPPVNENDRKISLSLSCTSAQKELYKAAAKKDGRKLPDFINRAIEEYIEKHKLK